MIHLFLVIKIRQSRSGPLAVFGLGAGRYRSSSNTLSDVVRACQNHEKSSDTLLLTTDNVTVCFYFLKKCKSNEMLSVMLEAKCVSGKCFLFSLCV